VRTFVLATANAHKVEEIRAVLLPLDVRLLPRPDDVPDVDETEETLEGNARLKALALVNATGHAALADDTGLFVEHLQGRPGVRSARYAGDDANDQENVKKLLGELDGIAAPQRLAYFRTVICVAYPNGGVTYVEGVLRGSIGESPSGNKGFGYDPVFEPDGLQGQTLAQLSFDEKNRISHRGRALRALVELLDES
jgi:XTP/dITP diphosphohydrolase